MQFSNRAWVARITMLTQWHEWFAWRPVRVAPGDYRWLEMVERKGGYDHSRRTGRRRPWRWEYRAA